MGGRLKLRPPPLKVNNQSHDISKTRRTLGPTDLQHPPPTVIYTYSPKIIHTDAKEFMSLVQRLTGSTPTRTLRCADHRKMQASATLDRSSSEGSSHGRSDFCDFVEEFKESTSSIWGDQHMHEQCEQSSAPANFSEEMAGTSAPSPHMNSHEEEDVLACLTSLTPINTNAFFIDLPEICSTDAHEAAAIGSSLDPFCSFPLQEEYCNSSHWLPSPASASCRDMAFALPRDDIVEQYQISI